MKKALILGLALALVGGAAYANFCARDYVPAATLLVPYAVVDLDATNVPDPNGYTTLLAVTNVSSTKQLIHVVVWDALSNPVVDFDEVLSGYDVWTINFRDLLNGAFNLFDTGDSDSKDNGSGPKPNYPQIGDFWVGKAAAGDQAPPYGPSSNVYTTKLPAPDDIDAPAPSSSGCLFPYGPLSIGGAIIDYLQAVEVGGLYQDGTACTPNKIAGPPWLKNLTDNPVFFYVTVDDVIACGLYFPDSEGYWDGHNGGKFPTENNVLIGDIIYVNTFLNFSESFPAVHIEADLDWPAYGFWHGGAQTQGFYSRYSVPFVLDDHEPLATAFAFRYADSGGISSNLMVWKNGNEWIDENLDGIIDDGDAWAACLPYIYYAFDENEESKARGGTVSGFNTSEPNALPFETQKVPLDVANWNGLMADNGWMLLVFDPSIPKTTHTYNVQAWAAVQYYFSGFSTALEAATLGNFWCFSTDILPSLNTYNGTLNGYLNYLPK